MASEIPPAETPPQPAPPTFVSRWKDTAVMYGGILTGTLAALTILRLYVLPNFALIMGLVNVGIPAWHCYRTYKRPYDQNPITQHFFVAMIFFNLFTAFITIPTTISEEGLKLPFEVKFTISVALNCVGAFLWFVASILQAFKKWKFEIDSITQMWNAHIEAARNVGYVTGVTKVLIERSTPSPPKTYPLAIENNPPASQPGESASTQPTSQPLPS
jgi:hypothetical protein